MGNASAVVIARAEAEYRIWREERNLRDNLAREAMAEAIRQNPEFLQSAEATQNAAARFYLLADAMITARRRASKEGV